MRHHEARDRDGLGRRRQFLVLAGLITPTAVVPTLWLLQGLDLFKTLHGQPPIGFLLRNRRIVAGLLAGAVKA